MRDWLLNRALVMTGNADSAEDLVQETMLRLWGMHDSLDARKDNAPLAFTIMRNRFIDNKRREHTAAERSLTDDDGSAADEEATSLGDMELIRRIIDRLPPLQRQTFWMKEVEGYEACEIMEITSCTAEALRQNLSRARRKIREEYIILTERRIKR